MSSQALTKNDSMAESHPAMAIRDVRLSDYQRIMDLYYAFDEVHYKIRPYYYKEPTQPARSKKFFLQAIYSPNKRIIVAESEGRILGFAHMTLIEAYDRDLIKSRRTLSVHEILVEDPKKNSHVSSSFAGYIAQYADECACDDFVVDVDYDNVISQKFLAKYGLQPVNIRLQKVFDQDKSRQPRKTTSKTNGLIAGLKIKILALLWRP